jgi:flagellar biosynthesis protein FliQ
VTELTQAAKCAVYLTHCSAILLAAFGACAVIADTSVMRAPRLAAVMFAVVAVGLWLALDETGKVLGFK